MIQIFLENGVSENKLSDGHVYILTMYKHKNVPFGYMYALKYPVSVIICPYPNNNKLE